MNPLFHSSKNYPLFKQCVTYHRNPQRIDGYNRDVQVDEILIFRRKNHVGRLVKQVWLVGGICTTPPYDFFLIIVPNKNSNTIKTVLNKWAHPDSNLKTDSWSACYRAASDLNFNSHKTVNHSVEFVAPDGTNTQLVENLRCVLKKWIRKNNYNHGDSYSLLGYLAEFTFKIKDLDIRVLNKNFNLN